MKLLVSFSFIFLFAGCASNANAPLSISASPNMHVTAAQNTIELSAPAEKANEYRDLFNQIYFNGDTVGFFTKFNGKASRENIKAVFTDKDSGISIPAERIECENGYIWGFILAGSMLEHFKRKLLFTKINSSANETITCNYTVTLSIYDGYHYTEKTSVGTLIIHY